MRIAYYLKRIGLYCRSRDKEFVSHTILRFVAIALGWGWAIARWNGRSESDRSVLE